MSGTWLSQSKAIAEQPSYTPAQQAAVRLRPRDDASADSGGEREGTEGLRSVWKVP